MSKISRRQFVESTGAGLVVATGVPLVAQEAAVAAAPPAQVVPRTSIKLVVNGTEHQIDVEDRWTLVDVLRDHLLLTGTKIGCDRGECGAREHWRRYYSEPFFNWQRILGISGRQGIFSERPGLRCEQQLPGAF